MSSADLALTPVIAIRDSDEITAVWLVPQLVLLKRNRARKTPAVPSGGVRNVEDTSRKMGYKPDSTTTTNGPRKPRSRQTAFRRTQVGVRRASKAVQSPSGFPSG